MTIFVLKEKHQTNLFIMKKNLKHLCLLMLLALFICLPASAAKSFVNFTPEGFVWIQNGKAFPILK